MISRKVLGCARWIGPLLLLLLTLSFGAPSSCAALIVNGDFEDPSPTHPGINSDYIHTPNGNTDEGTWWAYPDPGAPWHPVQHTPGGVGAMSANGADTTPPPKPDPASLRVWYQDVPVVSGQLYDFEAWALATGAGPGGYTLEYRFNGALAGTQTPQNAFVWEPFNYQYLATSNLVQIAIYDIAGNSFPNDFMLDDISLMAVNGTVPEPASFIVWGLGSMGLACFVRRRRRQSAAGGSQ
jgi:hypothetical protein